MTVNEIKFIKKLHQKKYRSEEKKFFVEGQKLFEEVVENCKDLILGIYCTNKFVISHSDLNFTAVSEKEMSRITALKNPSEILVVLKMSPFSFFDSDQSIFLENIKDPGNMGTIIRSADWFGINTIYYTKESVDIYNPKVIQATMGSFFRVKLIEASISELKSKNHTLIGATLGGENLNQFKAPEKYVLIIGNESKGIAEETIALLDFQVSIPGYGKAESLNASVATGILLYKLSQP